MTPQNYNRKKKRSLPVPVAARSKAHVCDHSPAENVGSNPTGDMDVCLSVCRECRVLSGRSLCDELITRGEESYRLWSVVVCDLEISRMRRPWPNGDCRAKKKQKNTYWRDNKVTLPHRHQDHHQEDLTENKKVSHKSKHNSFVCRSERNNFPFRPAHETLTDTQWHIPEVVLIQLILLMMSMRLLETCKELK